MHEVGMSVIEGPDGRSVPAGGPSTLATATYALSTLECLPLPRAVRVELERAGFAPA